MNKLIVIEGLDGSGKATQAALLNESLQKKGLRIKKVSFPDYDSPSSSLVKMYLDGEFGSRLEDVNAFAASSFYAVDRYASFRKNWERDWNEGIIVSDRYTTSNAIHQCSKQIMNTLYAARRRQTIAAESLDGKPWNAVQVVRSGEWRISGRRF